MASESRKKESLSEAHISEALGALLQALLVAQVLSYIHRSTGAPLHFEITLFGLAELRLDRRLEDLSKRVKGGILSLFPVSVSRSSPPGRRPSCSGRACACSPCAEASKPLKRHERRIALQIRGNGMKYRLAATSPAVSYSALVSLISSLNRLSKLAATISCTILPVVSDGQKQI